MRTLKRLDVFAPVNPCRVYGFQEFNEPTDNPEGWTIEEVLNGKKREQQAFTDPVMAVKAFLEHEEWRDQIGNYVSNSIVPNLSAWVVDIPTSEIPALTTRRDNYANCNDSDVSDEIDEFGSFLPVEQCLFHGGRLLVVGDRLEKPLSLTVNPQVAYAEGLRNASLNNWGEFAIFIFTVMSPRVKSFTYDLTTEMRHELEVIVTRGTTVSDRRKRFSIQQQLRNGNGTRPITVSVVTAELI